MATNTMDHITAEFIQDYLTQELGPEYLTYEDDIGCNSRVKIFRSDHQRRKDEEHNKPKGLVLKEPRNRLVATALERELVNLSRLAPYFPIPNSASNNVPLNVIHIPRVANGIKHGIFLTELLPGVNAASIFASASAAERIQLVRTIAGALRELHAMTWPNGAFEELYSNSIRKVSSALEQDAQYHYSATHHWFRAVVYQLLIPITAEKVQNILHRQPTTVSEAIEQAQDAQAQVAILKSYADLSPDDPYWNRPESSHLVLVHGDYMLPNILITDSVCNSPDNRYPVTGLVDWCDAGLGDARYDVWAGLWSIKFNSEMLNLSDIEGEALADAFLKTYYGTTEIVTDFSPWHSLYEVWDYIQDHL